MSREKAVVYQENKETVITRQITRVENGERVVLQDVLLKEEAYEFIADDHLITTFHCLPRDLEYLAVGYCVYRGVIQCCEQVKDVYRDDEQRKIYLQTCLSQASPGKDSALACYTAETIEQLKEDFEKHCALYRATGAAHSCALADSSGIIFHMNDAARHNALDKVVGAMLLRRISPEDKIIYSSARLSLDMIRKVSAAGVKLVAAPGSPTFAAVDLAEKKGITLMRFARKGYMNIYTYPERIL